MRHTIAVASILLVSWGCIDNPFSSDDEPSLNTSTRTHNSHFSVSRWDGAKWAETGSRASVTIEWRFIRQTAIGIDGGYAITFANPTSEDIEVDISRLKFYDADGIPIEEYIILFGDHFFVEAGSRNVRNGTFTILLTDMSVANEITRMGLWGSVTFPR